MSLIERAERLKKELTDKWVVVSEVAPELKRFAALTGKVRTVNMNCRALVEFDDGVDVGWYDIEPGFLTVVDAPKEKKKPAAEEKPAAAPRAATGAAPAAAGGSPLDAIRAAGAGAAKKPAAGGSPLDAIRAAGAAGARPAVADSTEESNPAAEPAPAAPAASPQAQAPPAVSGSPLDQIRAMGAAKKP